MMEEALSLLSTPSAWIIYFGCAFLIGMSKTGIQNLGTLAVPFFALLFGAKFSTGIVLLLLCMADIMAVIYYRKAFLWAEIKKLMPAALTGLVVALFLGNGLPDGVFKILMGACIFVGIAIMLYLERSPLTTQAALLDRKWYAPFFGFLVGFSTMIGNAAGPALSVYLLSKKLPKIAFTATAAWFIMMLNISKIPLQIWVWDNLSWAGFMLNLLALPFIILGGITGIWVLKIIPEKQFRYLIIGLVMLSSLLLMVL